MLSNTDFISWNYPDNTTDLCIHTKQNINPENTRKFKKIKNILYSNDYHIYYHSTYLNYNRSNITHLLEDDFKRISLSNNNDLNNPKLLFVSLYCDSLNNVNLGMFDENIAYKWIFCEMTIMNQYNNLYLNINNDKLIVSNDKCKWEISKNSFIKNITYDVYLSCDLNYNITISNNITDAIPFYIKHNSIHYLKPKINVDFEMNNIRNLIYPLNIPKIITNIGLNTGILLAAGTSSRFVSNDNKPKQLYLLNNLPVIMHSVNAMVDILDELIIITNSNCYEEIKYMTSNYTNITLIVNDVNCRLESIGIGLNYLRNKHDNVKNIVIHDSARPFIKQYHIQELIDSCDTYLYSQYYLKLVNGLCKKEYSNLKMLDRDEYIEICTPLASNFDMFHFIFMNYINKQNRITYEHISILDMLKIKYNLIIGNHTYLKKITVYNDIE